MMYSYKEARKLLSAILEDFRILSGDSVGPSGMTWFEISKNTSRNLRILAELLDKAREGETLDGPVVIPSPDDLEDDDDLEDGEQKGYDPIGGGGGHGRSDLPYGQGGGGD